MEKQFSKHILEAEVTELKNQYQIPGIGLGINHNGNRLFDKGFGFRDAQKQLPVTADTVFGIASMTKSFTCVAIMQLQDTGKLSVHDPVVTYVPEFRLPQTGKTEDVTIHHLMTHTTGLPPLSVHNHARKRSIDQDPTAKDYGLDVANIPGNPIDTDTELMERIGQLNIPLLGEPGECFSYSNESFGILGAVINRVSGMNYEDYVMKHILQPLKLQSTFFDINELENRENVTMLYATKKVNGQSKVYATPLWWDAPAMRAGGYLKSTVNDILTYLEIYRNKGIAGNERILSEESVQQMTYPHVEVEPGKFYGYGLSVIPDYYGSTFIGHGGGLKGVSSFMGVVPDKGLTGVVLTNLSGIPSETLLMGALNVVEDRQFEARPYKYQEAEVLSDDLHTFAGTYTSDEGMNVKLEVIEDRLAFFADGQYSSMRRINDTLFINKDHETVQFIKTKDGKVDRVCYSSRQIFKDKE